MNTIFEMITPENLVREIRSSCLSCVSTRLHHALQCDNVLKSIIISVINWKLKSAAIKTNFCDAVYFVVHKTKTTSKIKSSNLTTVLLSINEYYINSTSEEWMVKWASTWNSKHFLFLLGCCKSGLRSRFMV